MAHSDRSECNLKCLETLSKLSKQTLSKHTIHLMKCTPMTALRLNARLLGSFLLGTILGCITMVWYLTIFKPQPTISLDGMTTFDTATYENLYFTNAIYLQDPTIVKDTIYLRFRDDAAMNAVIDKRVVVSGQLNTVDIGDGETVTELDVLRVERIEP